jgi:hypothetical protein
MGKIKNSKKIIGEILCLIFGIACSLIGLYYYHFQYLCYYYTPLLIILAVVVCLGSALLSLCISIAKNKDKKAKIKNSVFSALVVAIILLVVTFIINLIVGKGEFQLVGLIVPVYLTFVITAVLTVLCVFAIFGKKMLKSIAALAVFIGFVAGSYSYIGTHIGDVIYENYKAPVPVLSTYKSEESKKVINGDFYVSTKGNDSNNGSKDARFLTIEKAIEAVRNTDKTNKKGITLICYTLDYLTLSVY